MRTLHSCSTCGLGDLCLPLGLENNDVPKLEEIVSAHPPRQRGQTVVRQGDKFRGVYAVKAGWCKSFRVDQSGVEHIQAFHLPGELFGLEAIYSGQHSFTVEALDTLVVCEMPFTDLSGLSNKISRLQQQLFHILSRELHRSYINPIEHYEQTTEQKLSGFIFDLWRRLSARGKTSFEFCLPMRRRDIANHLRLAPETISRTLRKLQDVGIIQLQHRTLRILDMPALTSRLHSNALEDQEMKHSLDSIVTLEQKREKFA